MKKLIFLPFLFGFCSILNASEDTASIKTELANLKNQVTGITDSVSKLANKVDTLYKEQIMIDASALDSARKHPEISLYKNYLFAQKSISETHWFFAILAFLILVLIWYWGIKYSISDGLCKDLSFDKDGSVRKPENSPYSYARVQLLWWTLIILSCYTFFFGVTGVLLPLNLTAALLMGFGAIVCGAGKIIDSRQIVEQKGERSQDLLTEANKPSFIRDILSDDKGISVHRYQAVIFNLIFGVGFIGFFITNLNHHYPFPDFTDWQFSLLGISSATYLGLKSFENKSSNPDPSSKENVTAKETGEVAAPKATNKF